MTRRSFTPTQITLAMVDIPAMVAFYAEQHAASNRPASAVVRDPDGNSIVFVAATESLRATL